VVTGVIFCPGKLILLVLLETVLKDRTQTQPIQEALALEVTVHHRYV
jgi:hypothetical protein